MTGRPLYLGIDLGTTNSTAAAFDGEKVTLVRNAQGTCLTPSVVRLDGRGHLTVGLKARRFLETDAENTRTEFKRLMGTPQSIEFPAAKAWLRPEELAAEILRTLREDTREQFGFLPERAVVSVPALFELPQCAATSEAARLAGFERVELIQEPVASALASGWSATDSTGKWLVYDLGGGTFDVSLLETRDGFLRVVGHDGDNFLGGRDFDWAIVDHVMERLNASSGSRLSRSDPEQAAAVRKLKALAEEAKIELSRARETDIILPGAFQAGGQTLDMEFTLNRDDLERLCTPLVERSLGICHRLLAAHGLAPGGLARVVLVGGPTLMPFLRRRIGEDLAAPLAESGDPMTLVAEGAAIYAMTARLDARPHVPEPIYGCQVLLQYPAISSDPAPAVIGKVLPAPDSLAPARVRPVRLEDSWSGETVPVNEDGGFVCQVALLPRRTNRFRLEGFGPAGQAVPLTPAFLSIVQGLSISDPPLSRSIGVALADDTVCIYIERGSPLPARRTFTHHTVTGLAKGDPATAFRIPIIQGEYEIAHLCRLVGTLEIQATAIRANLPAGARIEVTLDLDRSGRLSATAVVPVLGQTFEDVVQLMVPEADPAALRTTLDGCRTRLAELRGHSFRQQQARAIDLLAGADQALAEIERDLAALDGGDADAGQRARRQLIELEGSMEEFEAGLRWPELEDEATQALANASYWVSLYGTDPEQKLLNEAGRNLLKARKSVRLEELQRQLRVIRALSRAAFFRYPGAWTDAFEEAVSRAHEAVDPARAQQLIRDGRKARDKKDEMAFRRITDELWGLLPASLQKRRQSFDSGLR